MERKNRCGHEAVHSQAEWAMECSYQHLQEYKDCLEAEDVVAQTIKSFGVWDDLTHQEREDMRQMSSLVGEEQLPVLKTHFWNEWTSVWNEIPEFAQVGEDEMKKNWIRSKGTATLKDFVEKSKAAAFVFHPAISLQDIDDISVRAHAQKISSLVRERHIPIIEEAVELAYKKSLVGLPQYIIHGLEDWLRKNPPGKLFRHRGEHSPKDR